MKVIKKFKDKHTKKVYNVGDTYQGDSERVAHLVQKGLLEEPANVIKHVGGGWYEVNGQKVQGKEEAERIAGEA